MRRVLVVLLGGVAVVASGCDGAGVSVRWDNPRHRRTFVHIDAGHVCSNLCYDHFWNGSRVVVLSGHRHHSGCGHVFRRGHWIVFSGHGDRVHVTTTHRCTHDCHHHYWSGGHLVDLHGHHHGPGCGHTFHDGRWTLSISLGGVHVHLGASHICSSSCHDHYWSGSKYVVLKGHRHGPGCGHVFTKNRWLALKSKSHKARSHRSKHKAAPSSKAKIRKGRGIKSKAASKKARLKKGKLKKFRPHTERD